MAVFKNKNITLDDLPDCTVIAFQVGDANPNPALFEEVSLDTLKISGAKKLFIGGGYENWGWL